MSPNGKAKVCRILLLKNCDFVKRKWKCQICPTCNLLSFLEDNFFYLLTIIRTTRQGCGWLSMVAVQAGGMGAMKCKSNCFASSSLSMRRRRYRRRKAPKKKASTTKREINRCNMRSLHPSLHAGSSFRRF